MTAPTSALLLFDTGEEVLVQFGPDGMIELVGAKDDLEAAAGFWEQVRDIAQSAER